MKTILITGGTDGIGKGLAMDCLKKGHRVIVIGSNAAKGEAIYKEAKQIGAGDRAIFIQANLSLIKENQRIIEEIENKYHTLDALILCAQSQKYTTIYKETEEGFEFTFGLYYLSRYILSYGLKSCLENAKSPIIINVCAPGMKGTVNWDDLQHKKNYSSIKAIMHGSRLNDLLGVGFDENNSEGKIKYVLFNPVAVQTNGVTGAYEHPMVKFLIKLIYRFIGMPVEVAIKPIIDLLSNQVSASLSAFKQRKPVSLASKTFDKEDALRLYSLTTKLL